MQTLEQEKPTMIVVKHGRVEKEEHTEQQELRKKRQDLKELIRGLEDDVDKLKGSDYYSTMRMYSGMARMEIEAYYSRVTNGEIERLETQRDNLIAERDALIAEVDAKTKAKLEKISKQHRLMSKKVTLYQQKAIIHTAPIPTIPQAINALKQRTYDLVKAELDSVDLEDSPKVNALLGELQAMEAPTTAPKARRGRRQWLPSLFTLVGCAVMMVGIFTATAPVILSGFALVGFPAILR